MEVKELFKEAERMCDEQKACKDCPLNDYACCAGYRHLEMLEQVVDQWSKEHPIVTNADKFKEVFGKPIGSYGAPCPNGLTIYENGTMSNLEWLEQEYKEPKEDDNGNDR